MQITRKEPNICLFKHYWLNCIIQRTGWHLNWYVSVPKGHPLYWKKYYYSLDEDENNYKDEFLKIANFMNNICVHWWLTFAGDASDMWLEIDWYDWLFWFDTAHPRDAYYSDGYLSYREWDTYKDIEYVKKETRDLAYQISQYALSAQ